MVKRIVTTDDLTGNVIGQWMGGDEQSLAPVPGRTHREVAPDQTNYSGMRWNGMTFEVMPPPPRASPSPVEQQLARVETKVDALLARP